MAAAGFFGLKSLRAPGPWYGSEVSGQRNNIVILTGAGISADSGLKTFRDHDGLWEGHRVEKVATPEAWASDPQRVWRFYQQRRAQLQDAKPNAAHQALSDLARDFETSDHTRVQLITQNVDDLHQRAGSSAIAMHGELLKLRCEACGAVHHNAEDVDPTRFVACPSCEHPRLRPHIVWFGEIPLAMERIEAAMQNCSHFLAIGTSGVVYPAAGLLHIARQQGAWTAVNSLDAPDNLSPRDHFMPGPAAKIVPQMCAMLREQISGPSR